MYGASADPPAIASRVPIRTRTKPIGSSHQLRLALRNAPNSRSRSKRCIAILSKHTLESLLRLRPFGAANPVAAGPARLEAENVATGEPHDDAGRADNQVIRHHQEHAL